MCSDLDYEEMIAHICYDNNTICKVTQENGIENMEIEFFSPPEGLHWKFALNDYLEAIQSAKQCLIDTKKFPEE